MKYFLFFILLIFNSLAAAQVVKPLVRDQSFRTHLSIPFRVEYSDSDSAPLQVFNASIDPTYANNADCKILIDPYISSNFLVRCKNADDVRLVVDTNKDGEFKRITYGPITIIQISSGVVAPTGPAVNPDIEAGRVIVAGRCITCHTHSNIDSVKERVRRSSTALDLAVSSGSIPLMNNIVNASEISKIKAYINSLP